MEEILDFYYSNENKEMIGICNYVIYKLKWNLSEYEIEDLYSLADEVIIEAIKNYDKTKSSFKTHFSNCLAKRFISEKRSNYKDKRFANYSGKRNDGSENTIISYNTLINEKTESIEFYDIGYNLENDCIRFSCEVEIYFDKLSRQQKKIALLISEGYEPDDICKKLKIDKKTYRKLWERMISYEKTHVLYGLIERG